MIITRLFMKKFRLCLMKKKENGSKKKHGKFLKIYRQFFRPVVPYNRAGHSFPFFTVVISL